MARKMLAKEVPEQYQVSKGQQFICIALAELAWEERIGDWDRTRCTRIIEKLLGDSGTLESWLVAKGHLPENFMHDQNTRTKIMTTRRAWVDHLIKHYAAQGD
jgi:hypothetical protein